MMIQSNTHILSPNTQAILLLCSRLEQQYNDEPKPLNISEYNTIASWLKEEGLTPADLLDHTLQARLSNITIDKLDSERLLTLIQRGMMLSLSAEKWTNQGLWVIARSEAKYPQYLKKNLGIQAPPIIYGVGNQTLLKRGGLAIVGSRDIDEEAIEYTQRIVTLCAQQQMQIVSGGAKGVDQVSMLGCLQEGGSAIGVLADSLIKASVSSKYREAIKQGRLTLISAYHPDAGFSVGNAMGRNKYIYGLADYALIISSSVGKGGTWAGAVEALEKIKTIPVLVRNEGNVPSGNLKLLEKGAIAFPESPWMKDLSDLLPEYIENYQANHQNEISDSQPLLLSLLEYSNNIINSDGKNSVAESRTNEQKNPLITDVESPNSQQDDNYNDYIPNTIYEVVLPLILDKLKNPKTHKDLAKELDVQVNQIQKWLNIALKEKKIIKHKNPVTYEINLQK
ncbi:DNA-processing protein DprA [Geminocystis sp. CENA526]|uniref:DNA-processing protein DprA n=1 Tax=Geminocystis sp. CENA526 TaxID=1355871 RepID=UPI003D6E231D